MSSAGGGNRAECCLPSAVDLSPGAGRLRPHGGSFPRSSWHTKPHLSLRAAVPSTPRVLPHSLFPLLSKLPTQEWDTTVPFRGTPTPEDWSPRAHTHSPWGASRFPSEPRRGSCSLPSRAGLHPSRAFPTKTGRRGLPSGPGNALQGCVMLRGRCS